MRTAGGYAGLDPSAATARWQEASAYSHGLNWHTLLLGSIDQFDPVMGGYEARVSLDENTFERVVSVATAIAKFALARFASLAQSPFVRQEFKSGR